MLLLAAELTSLTFSLIESEIPPSYIDKVYLSSLSEPLTYESALFAFISEDRHSHTIRDVARDLARASHGDNDEALLQWINKRISKEKGHLQSLDVSNVVRYKESWGFKISVDAAQNLKNKAFSMAIVSLCPPASIYGTKIKYSSRNSLNSRSTRNDVFYSRKLDFNSEVKSPKWKDSFHVIYYYN